MLKCDFHMHSLEDPHDVLAHDSFELIDHAAKLGYQVLAITLHGKWHYPEELQDYAQSKGILLISGIETYIEKREVLVLGAEEHEVKSVKSFLDLRKLRERKGDDILVIAPHPFYGLEQCVGDKLLEYPDVFDAIELCHFYTKFWNPNKKAEQVAELQQKTMLACSDTHRLKWMKDHYVLVDAAPTKQEVFDAIRKNQIQNITRPLGLFEFQKRSCWHIYNHFLIMGRGWGVIKPKEAKLRKKELSKEAIRTAPPEVLHQ
jgi:predicted metal-dependent phosphoesterase TrpH